MFTTSISASEMFPDLDSRLESRIESLANSRSIFLLASTALNVCNLLLKLIRSKSPSQLRRGRERLVRLIKLSAKNIVPETPD